MLDLQILLLMSKDINFNAIEISILIHPWRKQYVIQGYDELDT